jgi:hypothetical protein
MLLKTVSTSLLFVPHLMVRWQTSHNEELKAIFGSNIRVFHKRHIGHVMLLKAEEMLAHEHEEN